MQAITLQELDLVGGGTTPNGPQSVLNSAFQAASGAAGAAFGTGIGEGLGVTAAALLPFTAAGLVIGVALAGGMIYYHYAHASQ